MELSNVFSFDRVIEEKLAQYGFFTVTGANSVASYIKGTYLNESFTVVLTNKGKLAAKSSCFPHEIYVLDQIKSFEAFPFVSLMDFTNSAVCMGRTVRYNENDVEEYIYETFFMDFPDTSVTHAFIVTDTYMKYFFCPYNGVNVYPDSTSYEEFTEYIAVNFPYHTPNVFLTMMPRTVPLVDRFYWNAIRTAIKKNNSIN